MMETLPSKCLLTGQAHPTVERGRGVGWGRNNSQRLPRGGGALTSGEGVQLHHGEEAAHGAIEGVQGTRRADARGQPRRPGRRGECQAVHRAEGPAVRGPQPRQSQGQPQAQQGRQEAWRAHHGVGPVGCRAGRSRTQAAERAGGARGRPCILHQPRSHSSQNRPDRFGLPIYLGAGPPGALEGQGRRPGVGGQGQVRTRPHGLGWDPGCPLPSPDPPGRATSELGRGGTSIVLYYLGWPNFKYYISCRDLAAQSGGWENSHPVKPWPKGWQDWYTGPGTRLLSGLLLGPGLSSPVMRQAIWSREAVRLCLEWLSEGPLRLGPLRW